MHLDNLLSAIQRSGTRKPLPVSGTGSGIRYVADPFPAFVTPTLRQDIGDVAEAQVVIISAPGAVGKSTLAKELARTSCAPLWDLALEKPIAGHSLLGALTEAFDAAALDARQGLKSGEFLLVIDALDEARIKTNEAAFEAFIKDVAKISRDSRGTSFVLLGRTQVAELAWTILDDDEVATALLEIESFNSERSREYIDRRVQAQSQAAWKRISEHRTPFEDARDVIFELLTRTIDGVVTPEDNKGAAHSFLGYAPVLDAITALFIGESNFRDLQGRITRDSGNLAMQHTPLVLLRRIVEEILDREHRQKLGTNIRPTLGKIASQVSWNSWETLYTPVEQVDRLLARITNTGYDYVSLDMPDVLRNEYEKRLQVWLGEHPFLGPRDTLANVVFESYVLARGLVAGTAFTRRMAEQFVRRSDYKHASLLAEFYLLFTSEMGDHRVAAEDIGILYGSMLAGDTESRRLRLNLDGPENMEESETTVELAGEFEFLSWEDDSSVRVLPRWKFDTQIAKDTTIVFEQSLREASILVPCRVQLGKEGSEFRLGPNVTLRAGQLLIHCKTLVVEPKPKRRVGDDGSVILEADSCDSILLERPAVQGELKVSWPGAEKYPWTDFNLSTPGKNYASPLLGDAYRRFRRIAQTLRSHSKGSLARLRDKVEHKRVLQGALGQRLLKRLVEDGILWLGDNRYHWDPEKATALVGISWMDLKKWSTSDRLEHYLESFIGANLDLT